MGGGGGAVVRSKVPIQDILHLMVEIEFFINLFLCLVSHNEQSDFHFDKNNIKFTFYIGLY